MDTKSSLAASPSNLDAPEARPTANFHPSVWGDTFLSYSCDETTLSGWRERAKCLRSEVQEMLTPSADDTLDNTFCTAKLSLIDTIQRLGIAYHFEEEIELVLARIFVHYNDQIHNHIDDQDDLNVVALKFRLLRQHGFNVSCDVFSKFIDNKGKFKESLSEDVNGILSLYESTHLRVQGEVILDDALNFAIVSLKSMLPHLSPFDAKQVLHALNRPIHKSLSRLDSVHYFSFYKELQKETLIELAELDFNILQKLHQQELSILSKWWKDLDVEHNLPFARDRLVECYFWILGVYFEPKYALSRKFLTQVIAMTSILDDIYDAHGTKEELYLFTRAIDKWDDSAMVDLPEYMKFFYRAMSDVYCNMEKEMMGQGKPIYGVRYAKEMMKVLARAYYEETKWLGGEFPTMEEYMKVALISNGYCMLAIASFVGMENVANEEAFEWLLKGPKISQASTVICRLVDDIVGHELEQKRGHIPSAVECFMKDHAVSKNEACAALNIEVHNAWKVVNEGLLRPTTIARALLMRILNLCRVIEVLYKDTDGYTCVNETIKEYVVSLLKNAVEI